MTDFTPTTEFLDFQFGLEAVTVYGPKATSGTAVAHAKRTAITHKEAEAGNGRYISSDVKWRLHKTEFATRPKLGGKIKDSDGTSFTILDVVDAVRRTEWACMTRALSIVAGLDCVVRIQRATFKADAAGADVPTFVDVDSTRARIQETSTDVAVEHGLRMTRRSYDIVIEDELEIDAQCIVIGPDGTRYEVTGYDRADQIGALPVIHVTNDPWPNV